MDCQSDAGKQGGSGLSFLFYCGNFLAAILVLLVSSFILSIYPFGDVSFLTEDLKFQYVDFFTWFQNVLGGEESVFYSTSQALGNNTWALYSYYLGSPLNLLIAFFDDGAITNFVYFVVAVKVGLIQVSIAFFLRRRFRLPFFWCFLLSLGFAWSSWNATQLRNPEWLDALIWLPLMAWGTHELISRRRWKLLTASIAFSIICCWYTAYMSILFICIYFALEVWIKRNAITIGCDRMGIDANGESERFRAGKPKILRDAIRFIGIIITGLLLSSFTFLPTVFAMMQKVSPELDIDLSPNERKLEWVLSFVIDRPWIIAAVVVAITALIALVIYLGLTKRMSRGRRIRTFAVLIVAVSFAVMICIRGTVLSTCGIVDLFKGFLLGGWEINSTPQLYGGALALILAISFFVSKSIPSELKVALLLFFIIILLSIYCRPLYFIWCGFKAPNGFFCRISFLAIFMIVWMAACFLDCNRNRVQEITDAKRAILYTVLACACVCDALISVNLEWSQLYVGYAQSAHEAYMQESSDELEEMNGVDDGIYRIAKNYTRFGMAALNEGMAIGYDEISSYSSANDANAIAFLNDLGYSKTGEFSTRYAYPLVASDALLGVKYVYSTEGAEGFEALRDSSNPYGAILYENPYALSLGYLVASEACDITFEESVDPFQRQNILIDAFVGYELDPYIRCSATMRKVSDSISEYDVEVPEGCLGYAFVVSDEDDPCYILMDGRSPFMENFRFQDSIYGIADASDEEQMVRLQLSLDAGDGSSASDIAISEHYECVFYALDLKRFEYAIDNLSINQMEMTSFSGKGIVGDIDINDSGGGLLMVSVPNSPGWKVDVNGSSVATVSIAGGALMGIPLNDESNHVEMRFIPPGLIVGGAISILGLAIVLIFAMVEAYARRGKTYER